MAWWDSIYTRLQEFRIPILGTLSLPTGSEDVPIAIANQLMGGEQGYVDVADIKRIPILRLSVPMSAITLESGDVVKYVLTSLPNSGDYVNGELQNWEQFWNSRTVLGAPVDVIVPREFFKNFKISQADDVIDNPLTYIPTDNDPTDEGWTVNPQIEADDEYRFAVRANFLTSGAIVGTYSDPYLLTNKSVFRDVITSDGSDDFKKSNGVVTPASITLTANLFKGEKLLNTGSTVLYSWRRLRSDGTWTLADKTTRSVLINPDDVLSNDTFECTQTFEGLVFFDKFTVNDISDGIGIVIDTDSSVDGYVFKANNLVDKDISFILYNNGSIVSFANLTSIGFTLDGTAVANGDTYNTETVAITDNVITIKPGMVDQKLTIKATIVFAGVSYEKILDITIVPEAEQLLFLYHDKYIDPQTGLEAFPPIVVDGSIADNITPNGTWYIESGVTTSTVYLSQKKGNADWVTSKIKGSDGQSGNDGPFRAEIFTRSFTQPQAPFGTITGGGINPQFNPVLPQSQLGIQWYTADPSTEGILWRSTGLFIDLVGDGSFYLFGEWSTPSKVDGSDIINELSITEKLFLSNNYA